MNEYFQSTEGDFILHHGDVRVVLPQIKNRKFDMIFADPPYFLSNGGFSVQAGKCVCVDKGAWDKSKGYESDREFTYQWIKCCQEVLTESGTIWICGTFHNIFSVATALTELGFRILNSVVWQKTNPPPNLSCRFFTHSSEFLVWARKSKSVPHYFNYDLMHRLAGDRQMTDVWRMPAIAPWEKTCGKHPTQKPLALCARTILASTRRGDFVLDPFTGSSSTGIAACMLNRNFIGIDAEQAFLQMSRSRYEELLLKRNEWMGKIPDLRGMEGTMD